MQSLHPFRGSIQQYVPELSDPDRYRPDHCPLCHAPDPLRAHGFYCRTLVDVQYDGAIRVRRYLCLLCKRTVSLLPEFVLPYLRFSIPVMSLFLVSPLLHHRTLQEAAGSAFQASMPYQRGQFWVERFKQQAMALSTALASGTAVVPTRDFLTRAVTDAGGARLDPSASSPFRRTTWPLGWAGAFSHSARLSRQPVAGFTQFPIPNTQLLSWRQLRAGYGGPP